MRNVRQSERSPPLYSACFWRFSSNSMAAHMKSIARVIPILFFLFQFGCSSVVSLHPVGREKMVLEPQDWDGTWLADENVVKMKVVDGKNGIVKMGWIEEGGNELRPQFVTFQVLKGEKWIYANVLEMEGKKDGDAFYWGVVKKEQGRIVFLYPAVTAFVEAAQSNRIKADIERHQSSVTGGAPSEEKSGSVKVILTDTPESVVQLVEGGGGDYLDVEHPVVFIRLFHQ